jgi:hypothetical protein
VLVAVAIMIACSDKLESAFFVCSVPALDTTWAASLNGDAAGTSFWLFDETELFSWGGKDRVLTGLSMSMSSTASLSPCLTRFAEGGVRRELLIVASSSLSAYRARFRGEVIAIAKCGESRKCRMRGLGIVKSVRTGESVVTICTVEVCADVCRGGGDLGLLQGLAR